MNEKLERLPDSELAVMQVIWTEEIPIGSGKVVQILEQERGWTRSTVQVLLKRLEEKGFLGCEREGRLKFYCPLVAREDYVSKETKTFLEHFYQNSYQGLIASLVKSETIREEDIDEIVSIITNNSRK
ncbi:MAG: BlaI/MecI/CopY family transcriptional regulator [Lachnospiraceae bacterium]|nr:BlaI/MecI/CopY family transcriptional regulator [Lachnospiraceae bacterium]